MVDAEQYYIEVVDKAANAKGFVVQAEEGFGVSHFPTPEIIFFDGADLANAFIASNSLNTDLLSAVAKNKMELVAEGALSVATSGWCIENDDNRKLCVDFSTGLHYWKKCDSGYLVWVDKKAAETALIKFTKHFHVMRLWLKPYIPEYTKK